MIDNERRNELENALAVLTRHNLYRRGYCDMEAAEVDGKELGVAIDAAAGAILEYLRLSNIEETAGKLKQSNLFLREKINLIHDDFDRLTAENKRLKSLLASHKIKYKAK